MNAPPRWFELLEAHSKRGRYGLTIAFLIGAMREPAKRRDISPEDAKQSILDLLTSFAEDAPEHYAVRVSRCPQLNEPVAAVFYTDEKRLLLDAEFQSDGKCSVPDLAEKLFAELKPAIYHGRFSFRAGKYEAFSEEDLTFIDMSKRS